MSAQDKSIVRAYKRTVSVTALEQTLRDFERIATPIAQYADRQIWQFAWDARAYLLCFYPRPGFLRRISAGNTAHRHFFGLQTLQKLGIPSPRAIAHLAGFRIGDHVGDAVIVESLDGAVNFEEYLVEHDLCGDLVPDRRALARQVASIVQRLGLAKLGHSNLSLSSFLIRDGILYLAEAQHVHRGGLKIREVMRLGHSASRFATRGEMRRAWELLQPGASMPRSNPVSMKMWNRFIRSILRESEQCGRLEFGKWRGVFSKHSDLARGGAISSRLDISRDDWQRAWPDLLRRIDSGELAPLKRDASGEIFDARIELAGRTIPVILKRPRNKFWYRYLLDAFRSSRARRTWIKTWKTIIRGLPTEWPMLLMERRVSGYVTDAIIVFERVEGRTLDRFDLDSLSERDRATLFRRAGRTLRTLERTGLSHMDAKSTNWIIMIDEKRGPVPVMIDLFGIRGMNFTRRAFGILRLLRAMRQHPQYTPADSLNLCLGFAPFSRVEREDDAVPAGNVEARE